MAASTHPPTHTHTPTHPNTASLSSSHVYVCVCVCVCVCDVCVVCVLCVCVHLRRLAGVCQPCAPCQAWAPCLWDPLEGERLRGGYVPTRIRDKEKGGRLPGCLAAGAGGRGGW